MFENPYRYTVVVVAIALAISFGLQALGLDATIAQLISFGWILVAYLIRHAKGPERQ